MIGLLLVADALGFVALLLAGAWLSTHWPACRVCADDLAAGRWGWGVCTACWATWAAAEEAGCTAAWEAAFGLAYRRGLTGGRLRRQVARAVWRAGRGPRAKGQGQSTVDLEHAS